MLGEEPQTIVILKKLTKVERTRVFQVILRQFSLSVVCFLNAQTLFHNSTKCLLYKTQCTEMIVEQMNKFEKVKHTITNSNWK